MIVQNKNINEDLIEEFDNVGNYLLSKIPTEPNLWTTFSASIPYKDSLLGKQKVNIQPQLVTTTMYNTSPGKGLVLNFGYKNKDSTK